MTVNATGWGSFKKAWPDWSSCSLILVQEHHLAEAAVPPAKAWLEKRGYHSAWEPALATGQGRGTSGGVAILWARSLMRTGQPFIVEEGRAIAVQMRIAPIGEIMVATAYGFSGGGDGAENAALVCGLMDHLQRARLPFVVGGDFNCGPRQLERLVQRKLRSLDVKT